LGEKGEETFALFRSRFLACMDDDFNTGGAVGVLYELLTALNRHADQHNLEAPGADAAMKKSFEAGVGILKELSQVLGIFRSATARAAGGDDKLVSGLLQLLVDLRAECRKAKNFAMSDEIRDRLKALGVTLEDRPGGTGWRIG
jgi:cysteinyl-tRNA synthetase